MPTVTAEMIRDLRDRVGPDGLETIRRAKEPTRIITDYLYYECGWRHGDVDDLTDTVISHMLSTRPGSLAPMIRGKEIEW